MIEESPEQNIKKIEETEKDKNLIKSEQNNKENKEKNEYKNVNIQNEEEKNKKYNEGKIKDTIDLIHDHKEKEVKEDIVKNQKNEKNNDNIKDINKEKYEKYNEIKYEESINIPKEIPKVENKDITIQKSDEPKSLNYEKKIENINIDIIPEKPEDKNIKIINDNINNLNISNQNQDIKDERDNSNNLQPIKENEKQIEEMIEKKIHPNYNERNLPSNEEFIDKINININNKIQPEKAKEMSIEEIKEIKDIINDNNFKDAKEEKNNEVKDNSNKDIISNDSQYNEKIENDSNLINPNEAKKEKYISINISKDEDKQPNDIDKKDKDIMSIKKEPETIIKQDETNKDNSQDHIKDNIPEEQIKKEIWENIKENNDVSIEDNKNDIDTNNNKKESKIIIEKELMIKDNSLDKIKDNNTENEIKGENMGEKNDLIRKEDNKDSIEKEPKYVENEKNLIEDKKEKKEISKIPKDIDVMDEQQQTNNNITKDDINKKRPIENIDIIGEKIENKKSEVDINELNNKNEENKEINNNLSIQENEIKQLNLENNEKNKLNDDKIDIMEKETDMNNKDVIKPKSEDYDNSIINMVREFLDDIYSNVVQKTEILNKDNNKIYPNVEEQKLRKDIKKKIIDKELEIENVELNEKPDEEKEKYYKIVNENININPVIKSDIPIENEIEIKPIINNDIKNDFNEEQKEKENLDSNLIEQKEVDINPTVNKFSDTQKGLNIENNIDNNTYDKSNNISKKEEIKIESNNIPNLGEENEIRNKEKSDIDTKTKNEKEKEKSQLLQTEKIISSSEINKPKINEQNEKIIPDTININHIEDNKEEEKNIKNDKDKEHKENKIKHNATYKEDILIEIKDEENIKENKSNKNNEKEVYQPLVNPKEDKLSKNEEITFLKDDIKNKDLEEDKIEEINKINNLKDDIPKENDKYENKNIKRKEKPEKIGIIETYSIDDRDESENDIQKDKSKEFKEKEKHHLNIINKQIINTLDSANSESIEKEKEVAFDIKFIYAKPKNEIEQDILEENNKNNINENKDEYNLNKEEERKINDKLTLSEKNKQLENYINEYMTKDKDNYNDKDENYELDYNQKNKYEKIDMNEKNISNIKLIKRIELNQQNIQNKLLKLIKIKNPLNKYFKRWVQILYTSEIEIPFKNKQEIENPENINDEKNEKIYENEDIYLNKNDENKNIIYSQKNKIKRENKHKKLFIHNVQRRIKLKNIIIKYINNLPKKHELYYYFNDWKNKSNNEIQFDTIKTSINQKTHITRRRFIPGKKVLPFEKLEKFNQINNPKSPRPINNIITKNEKKQKKKILTKLVIKKVGEESVLPLKRYLNIWKQNIQINKDEDEDEENNIDNIDNEIINTKEKKYIITYKRRKIINKYDTDDRNNNDKINIENKNNLYRKHRVSNPNIFSPIHNNRDDKVINKEEEIKDNNVNNNLDNNINIKEIIKKFVLPMPKKEEVKECPLIISPVEIKEEFDELNLDMDKLDIKNTPKKPKIKFSKKINNNIHKLINHRYKTDIDLLGPNKNKNKIITNININYKDNKSEKGEEKENTTNIPIIQKVINVTTDIEEPNTITLKNDPSIENNDFGHKSKHITYKKIIKTVKNYSKNDNEKNIGRNIDKTLYTYDSRHIKAKTFISENVIKNEDINKIKKFNLDNKICKKEYIINYDDLILCEEIIYKCNDPVNEKILNIKPVQKPKKIEKNNKYKSPIISPIYDEKKESIFVQKVIRYKKQEKKYGYGIDKSPMRLPINPNDIELQISALSPFNRSSRDFYKKEIKQLNKLEEIIPPKDMCITDRGNKKDTLLIFNSPKMNNSDEINNNNNIFDNTYSDNYENEINDPELNNNINKEFNLTKKLADFHLRFFKDLPEKSFNRIQPRILYNIINKGNEKLALLKIFYIYEKYKMNEYSIKKMYLRKWQRALNFFDINIDNNIHIINKLGHCLSAKNIVIREIRCGIHKNYENDFNCSCLRMRIKLKKILLRHHLLRDIDQRKYYLFKWYKNTFRKIRSILQER